PARYCASPQSGCESSWRTSISTSPGASRRSARSAVEISVVYIGLRSAGLLATSSARGEMRNQLAAQDLVEVLHSVFHRRLIRTLFAAAGAVERVAAGVHPLGNLVVFARSLQVRGLLGVYELAFEERDVLGIVELDDVGGAVYRARD